MRDYATAKQVGKEFIGAFSLDFGEDGQLKTSGQLLGSMPLGTWTHFEIRLQVGENTPRTYQLEITSPGADKRSHIFPIGSPGFRVFTWLGVIAGGEKSGVFHLDNLVLRADPAP